MADPRDYLAAERTFLAWLRTGLALMGFGFVVARFGLFLQQIQFLQHAQPARSTGLSLWLGTLLIAAGITVCALSAWRHVRMVRMFDENRTARFGSPRIVIAIAVFLVLVGVAMAVYLLSFGRSVAG
jgi:putative membrane protein